FGGCRRRWLRASGLDILQRAGRRVGRPDRVREGRAFVLGLFRQYLGAIELSCLKGGPARREQHLRITARRRDILQHALRRILPRTKRRSQALRLVSQPIGLVEVEQAELGASLLYLLFRALGLVDRRSRCRRSRWPTRSLQLLEELAIGRRQVLFVRGNEFEL